MIRSAGFIRAPSGISNTSGALNRISNGCHFNLQRILRCSQIYHAYQARLAISPKFLSVYVVNTIGWYHPLILHAVRLMIKVLRWETGQRDSHRSKNTNCIKYVTMAEGHTRRILKLWSVLSRSHRLILRSSAERYVQSSLFTEMELMWYV